MVKFLKKHKDVQRVLYLIDGLCLALLMPHASITSSPSTVKDMGSRPTFPLL